MSFLMSGGCRSWRALTVNSSSLRATPCSRFNLAWSGGRSSLANTPSGSHSGPFAIRVRSRESTRPAPRSSPSARYPRALSYNSWGSASTCDAPRTQVTPRRSAPATTAVLRTIIPGLSLGGDEDRVPARAIETQTGRSGRAVPGQTDILHPLLARVPNHGDRPVGRHGRPGPRGDLPESAKGVGHDVEPPVVHHELDVLLRSRAGQDAFRLQDRRQVDAADQRRALRQHHRTVRLERERNPEGMLLERQRLLDGLGRVRGAGRRQKEKQRYPGHPATATPGSNPHAPDRPSGTHALARHPASPGSSPGGVARRRSTNPI